MATTGPIQVPAQLSQLTTLPDLIRFVSSFAAQAASQFNGLFATKTAWGAIGASGTIITSSGNFGVSLVSTGIYNIAFREPYSERPVAVVTPEAQAAWRISESPGVTLASFQVRFTATLGGTAQNTQFSFIAMGAR